MHPFVIGFTVLTILQTSYPELIKELNPSQLFALMIFILIPVLIILEFIDRIFSERKDTLVAKMMKCTLRKKHGRDYCAKCPDSYKCPTDLGGTG